jgi:hypothetical protein
MVLPPTTLPDILRGVDDLIRSGFEEFRELWFTRLLVSTALVVAGLLFEAPEIWHESVEAIRALCHSCKPKRDIPAWMKLVGTLGWVLIVVGVTGEFVADSFVSKADGFVQKFDEILLADAQRKTGLASERAAMAFERAAKTEREASQENERAARTEQQAAEENARAAKALESAEIARKGAEGFQLQIAQANERAAEAQMETARLEQQMADRTLTVLQQNELVSRLAPFAGTVVDVLVWGDSAEIQGISGLVLGSMTKAGWKVQPAQAIAGGAAVRGILVGTKIGSDAKTAEASGALIAALRSAGLSAGPWPFEKMPNPGASMNSGFTGTAPIKVFIGSKP